MRILMVAAEAAPYVKVGGLADMVGALFHQLGVLGAQVDLLLPGHRRIDRALGFQPLGTLAVPWAGRAAPVRFLRLVRPDGLTVTLVDDVAAFDRDGVYDDPASGEGYWDNPERFAFFARAAAEYVIHEHPGLVHVHDAHGALLPGLLRVVVADRLAGVVPTVLTIHNLAHPLPCRPETLFDAGFPRALFFPASPLEFHGHGNFLKTGIVYADAITTVSERYAQEIQTPQFGHGLDGLLRSRAGDLIGILNGIDEDVWNPATDPYLPARYDASDPSGKERCRAELLRAAGLDDGGGAPLVGMIGRLADQKGLDLFAAAAAAGLVDTGARFTILGSGQEKYHRLLNDLHRWRPDRFAVHLGFHEELAHQIEAGSDFFLMPSRFEPCGLNQMYSMRYGTIPIVRRTGGLADTVVDCEQDPEYGTGLAFDAPSGDALLGKVWSAARLHADPARRRAVMLRGMAQDFSMRRTAERYRAVYQRLAARARGTP